MTDFRRKVFQKYKWYRTDLGWQEKCSVCYAITASKSGKVINSDQDDQEALYFEKKKDKRLTEDKLSEKTYEQITQ